MTSLPAGWARATLGDLLLAIEAGKSFTCQSRPADTDEWGVIKVSAMTWGTFRENENKAIIPGTDINASYEISSGDILLSRANTQEYVGASVLVGPVRPRLLLSDKSLRLVPAAGINRRWLAYFLSSPAVRSVISTRASGTKHSMRNISQQALREIEVRVPPAAEQGRIVTLLDDLLSRLDVGLASVRSAAARGRMLQDRLTETAAIGGFVTGDRAAVPPRPAGVDDGALADLPLGWRWVRLGDIADVVGGFTKDAKKQSDPSFVEVPYLRVANVQRGRLNLDDIATIRIPSAKAKSLYLQAGDVLLNEGGDRDKLGRGWVWEEQIADCVHQNHVFRARIKDGILHPKLLAWHANGFGKRWCEKNGKQSVNLASISLSKIKLLPVPLPPQGVQEQLVDEVETRTTALALAIGSADEALSRGTQLRSLVLARAIEGRLTTRDETDEPAPLLIRRIQAGRAQAGKAQGRLRPPGDGQPGGRLTCGGGITMTQSTAATHTDETRQLVAKLWSYCHVLRDDGVPVLDYVEQLTYLLFLKMAHEQKNRRLNRVDILDGLDAWQILLDSDGRQLELEYAEILAELARKGGTLGRIFQKSQNRIQDPAKLKRLINELIDKENWSGTDADIKGDAYEELLARGAEDIKSGAGQYFTPRALIKAVVDCVQPTPDDSIIDPACGTGGFLLSAFDYIQHHHAQTFTPEQRYRLASGAIRGNELVDATARLAAMNLLLHGIGQPNGEALVDVGDALAKPPTRHGSVVLANPPFGRKSSITIIGENDSFESKELTYNRRDFWTTTTNKQLNFVQHIYTLLRPMAGPPSWCRIMSCSKVARRDHPTSAAQSMRRAYDAPAPDRHLLRGRSQGERPIFR